MRRIAIIACGIALALTVIVIPAIRAGYVVNTTPSVPRGLWRVSPTPVERGAVALICPPDTSRFRAARDVGVVPPGRCPGNFEPLLKPVAALPGDCVQVDDAGVTVNGQRLPSSSPVRDHALAALLEPFPTGEYIVRTGELWLVSVHPRSWDSRYFGALPIAGLQGVVHPVLTESP